VVIMKFMKSDVHDTQASNYSALQREVAENGCVFVSTNIGWVCADSWDGATRSKIRITHLRFIYDGRVYRVSIKRAFTSRGLARIARLFAKAVVRG